MKLFYHYFSIFFLILILNCIATEPFYLITQGYQQVKYVFKKKSIKEILEENKVSEEVKNKLILLNQIKYFAKEKLKLNTENQFDYLLEINGNSISYIVIASFRTKLKPKEYWFPFVGNIYYLGFFDKQDAIEYAKYLETKNWDVKISGVDAYSTLGWFSDPILSYHLKKDEIDLVSLVIHELTHNTFWKKDQNDYNETLATFIEEQGTYEYIKEFKKDNKELIDKFFKKKEEEKKIQLILFNYRKKLQELYETPLREEEILVKKDQIFQDLKNYLASIKNEFQIISLDYYIKKNYNNADFVLLNLYENQELLLLFKKIFSECKNNFECFWKNLKK